MILDIEYGGVTSSCANVGKGEECECMRVFSPLFDFTIYLFIVI